MRYRYLSISKKLERNIDNVTTSTNSYFCEAGKVNESYQAKEDL